LAGLFVLPLATIKLLTASLIANAADVGAHMKAGSRR
jgi:hypothetical protein